MTEELPVGDPDEELCVWCGETKVKRAVGRRRRYCSHACRQAAYERRRIERAVQAALAVEREDQEDGPAAPAGAA